MLVDAGFRLILFLTSTEKFGLYLCIFTKSLGLCCKFLVLLGRECDYFFFLTRADHILLISFRCIYISIKVLLITIIRPVFILPENPVLVIKKPQRKNICFEKKKNSQTCLLKNVQPFQEQIGNKQLIFKQCGQLRIKVTTS